MQFLLGLGIGTDTETDDRLDLMADPYHVLAGHFRVDEDANDPRFVYVVFGMHMRGESQNALLNARNAIVDKLNQATLGGSGIQDWVTLGVKLNSADEMVWWHVVDGSISAPGALFPPSYYIGHMGEPFEVTLRCERGAFGEPLVDEPVVVNGSDPTLYRAGIPGTLPAYVEAVITDTSENSVVLHGIGVGSRSAKDMADGDFEPFQTLTDTNIGTLDPGALDAIDTTIVRGTPGVLWAAIGYAKPTEAQMRGRYDLWLRMKDDTPYLDTPLGLRATPVEGANQRQERTGGGEDETTGTVLGKYATTLPGNTLFLDVYATHPDNTPVIDSVPSGFVLVDSSSQGKMLAAAYVYPNAPATSGDLDVTFTTNVYSRLQFSEWSGLVDDPADVSADNAESSSTTHETGTTGTTAVANTLARTLHIYQNKQDGPGTGAPYRDIDYTDGYRREYAHVILWGTSPWRYRTSYTGRYRILTSTGAQTATMTTGQYDTPVATASANLITTYSIEEGGALAADTYHYRIAAIDTDGRLSRASVTAAVYHPAGNAATQLEWEPSLSPALDGYRVYFRKGTGTWNYFDTPDTVPAFLHVTVSGPDGTEDPPDTGFTPAYVRLSFGLGDNGEVMHVTRPVLPKRANDIWEWLQISTEDLSVLPRPMGEDQPDYRVLVEVRGGEGTVDGNVLGFIPADEAFFYAHVDEPLESVREWVMGTNANGQRFAWVRDPADDTDVSGAISEGTFAIGPGDTKLLFLLYGPDGQSVVDDASAQVQLTIYPRWHWLAGSIS